MQQSGDSTQISPGVAYDWNNPLFEGEVFEIFIYPVRD
jgi:hypothetical protein